MPRPPISSPAHPPNRPASALPGEKCLRAGTDCRPMLQAGVHSGDMAGAVARLTGWLLVPLGLYILVSALDDLVIDLLWLLRLACGCLLYTSRCV